jgi:hypothetical protein
MWTFPDIQLVRSMARTQPSAGLGKSERIKAPTDCRLKSNEAKKRWKRRYFESLRTFGVPVCASQ